MIVRYWIAVLITLVSLGTVGSLATGSALAAKTIHVGQSNNNSLADVQSACLSSGGSITSWTFIINQLPRDEAKPGQITVVFDTNGDGNADSSVNVPVGPQGGASNAHYTVSGSGVVLDAYTSVADSWSGQFVLSHVECGPPLDACTPFANRIIVTFNNVRLGAPFVPGLTEESGPVAINVAAGTYAVTLRSFDEHSVIGGLGQMVERWFARFTAGVTVDSAAIADLPENQDFITQQVGTVTFAVPATQVIARHLLAGGTFTSGESIEPVCIALDRLR